MENDRDRQEVERFDTFNTISRLDLFVLCYSKFLNVGKRPTRKELHNRKEEKK